MWQAFTVVDIEEKKTALIIPEIIRKSNFYLIITSDTEKKMAGTRAEAVWAVSAWEELVGAESVGAWVESAWAESVGAESMEAESARTAFRAVAAVAVIYFVFVFIIYNHKNNVNCK